MAKQPPKPAIDLSIGALSRRTGIGVETIRYYERIGLVPEPPRTAGGRRVYHEDDVQCLQRIRRARALGFSLEQVRALVQASGRGGPQRDKAWAIAQAHLEQVRQKIAGLQQIELQLDAMVSRCAEGTAVGCPIIQALSGEAAKDSEAGS